jgi:hypothetical protein
MLLLGMVGDDDEPKDGFTTLGWQASRVVGAIEDRYSQFGSSQMKKYNPRMRFAPQAGQAEERERLAPAVATSEGGGDVGEVMHPPSAGLEEFQEAS